MNTMQPTRTVLRHASLFGRNQLNAHLDAHFNNAAIRPSQRQLIVAQGRRGLSELLSLGDKKKPDDGREPLAPGKVSPPSIVPAGILKPPYADSGRMPEWDERPQVHDATGIAKMRAAGKLAAQVRDMAGELAKPGVTTDEIDKAVHKMIIEAGAYPSPLNYGGFPKSVCTSINECICHGIPDSRPLKDGDIVNIDVTVYLDGYHGDCSKMCLVGNVSPEAQKLCRVTKESLDAAIALCAPGVRFSAIGAAIQKVAEQHKYGICKGFVGHGVGTVFHSYPHILHYKNNSPGVMQAGMTFTIEPMLTQGNPRERFWNDGWTAVTVDGGLSAQYEHTLLITDSGVEILTLP